MVGLQSSGLCAAIRRYCSDGGGEVADQRLGTGEDGGLVMSFAAVGPLNRRWVRMARGTGAQARRDKCTTRSSAMQEGDKRPAESACSKTRLILAVGAHSTSPASRRRDWARHGRAKSRLRLRLQYGTELANTVSRLRRSPRLPAPAWSPRRRHQHSTIITSILPLSLMLPLDRQIWQTHIAAEEAASSHNWPTNLQLTYASRLCCSRQPQLFPESGELDGMIMPSYVAIAPRCYSAPRHCSLIYYV